MNPYAIFPDRELYKPRNRKTWRADRRAFKKQLRARVRHELHVFIKLISKLNISQ